jgi:hypothetical protein
MGFLDVVLSLLPNVPFLPPSTPTKDNEAGKHQKENGAFSRFVGTSTQPGTANKKDTSDQTTAES